MTISSLRIKSALKVARVHFVLSLITAVFAALFIFNVWFPFPYREFAGGKDIFLLMMGVDMVCGPMLTLVLYNKSKPRRELLIDLGLVVLMQLTALFYGVWTMHQVRPLYLVHEVDRFRVISLTDVDLGELVNIPEALKVGSFGKPKIVSLRELNVDEKKKILFESISGGRDYGDHPSFYLPYDIVQAARTYSKAKPIGDFIAKYPSKAVYIEELSLSINVQTNLLRYLPIKARQDWVAVLDDKGKIVGYCEGDGF